MDATIEAVQDIVSAEPEAEAQPGTAQPDDTAIETKLSEQIRTLWTDHVRLSADRKATAKELRQIRTSLAERLAAMKSRLSHPGRSGEWRGWLRQHGIPRSTADRLVSRHAETLTGDHGNVPTGAISNSPEDSAEKLAKSVWQRFGKTLSTDGLVIRFIDRIVELSGVGYERRDGGLMVFCPVLKAVDGVIGNDAAAEITCPTPQPAESGEANPADAPAADPEPQLSDDMPATSDELPASAPAIDPVPQSMGETSITTASEETATTPNETGQPTAVDAGESSGCMVAQ
jgi:hypothetical protein